MVMLLLLSMSLSLDAFAVSCAYGLRSIRIPMVSKLVICFISILYFGAAVWFGNQISLLFTPQTAKIIGIVLMSGICLWMLLQIIFGKSEDEQEEENRKMPKTLFEFTVKSIGLSFKVIRDPMLCDIDKSNSISPGEALLLGTALSVDSISVGIGYSLLGNVHMLAPLMVGLFQFLFICAGNFAGHKFTSIKMKNTKYLQFVSVAVIFALILVRIFS